MAVVGFPAMRKNLLLAALVVAATATASHAADLKLPFEKYQLGNGLEVLLSEDHHVPVVHVQVWYHVGSKDEQAGKTGFAHLFEHMMFQSARDIAEDTWFKKLDAVGGFGINGTTNTERTNYFESVPSNQLALALWMESDRMGFLLDTLDDKQFHGQQDVVRNERRQSYEMRPYGNAAKAIQEAMYPASHPYHHTTIGEHEDLQRASVEDVKAFFRTFYVPSNATLAITGDFKPQEAKALVEKYFGTLPKAQAPKHPTATAPTAPVVREVAMEANVQLPRFEYEWHGPVPFGADEAELDLVAMMLGGGKSSRLYKKLVYDTQVAQSVRANVDSREYGGDFGISVTLKPDHTIADGRKLVDEELARLAKEPFTAAELDRAKTRVEASFLRQLETNQGRAHMLQNANHYTHDPARGIDELNRYRAVTLEGVQAAVNRWLTHPKLVVTIVPNKDAPLGGRMIQSGAKTPAKVAGAAPPPANANANTNANANANAKAKPNANATAAVNASDPWRKDQPKGGPAPEVTLPKPKQAKLANGLPVLLVENHDLPLVEAYLMLYAGAERTPSAQAGLADLTASLLDEGTAKHDALALADALEDVGARLSTSASHDAAYISLNALSAKLDPALDLFAEVVTSPAFADKDFERVRSQRLTALLQQKDQPAVIANNVAGRVVYGAQHPYAFPLLGTEEALKSFGRKDVVGFYDTYYRPNNATLIVVGDITLPELTKKLDARLAAWKSKPVKKATPPGAPPPLTARKVILVDQPQASQSVIGLAQVGVPRSSKDYVPLTVANYILGGAFSSRINMNLREKNGYSYGARSTFSFWRGPGLFFAGGNVRGNVTKEALSEMMKEIAAFRAGKVTDEELNETRSSLIGKMPSRFETNGAVASMLAELVRNGLPLDYYASFAKKVAAVTAADVQRVAQKYLVPDKAQIVVVGDRASVETKVKELDLGPLELRGRFGEPITAETGGTR
jgi:zinc protease